MNCVDDSNLNFASVLSFLNSQNKWIDKPRNNSGSPKRSREAGNPLVKDHFIKRIEKERMKSVKNMIFIEI